MATDISMVALSAVANATLAPGVGMATSSADADVTS